jgi:hypothetical protein
MDVAVSQRSFAENTARWHEVSIPEKLGKLVPDCTALELGKTAISMLDAVRISSPT